MGRVHVNAPRSWMRARIIRVLTVPAGIPSSRPASLVVAHRGLWPGPRHAARPANHRSRQPDHHGRFRTTPRLRPLPTLMHPTLGSTLATNATDDARHRSIGGSLSPRSTRSARPPHSIGRRHATARRTCPVPPQRPRRDPRSGDEASPSAKADVAHTTRVTRPGHLRRSQQSAPHHWTTTDPRSHLHSRAPRAQRFTSDGNGDSRSLTT